MNGWARAALISALALSGASVHCGGRVDSAAATGKGDGSGANGSGSGASSSGSGGSSFDPDGSAGGVDANGGQSNGSGGTGSGGDWRSGQPWPLSTGGAPPPPPHRPGWKRLEELEKLRMDEDLSVLAPDECPTTLSLEWDLERDGTIDATERRIFDAEGRLVAAELTSVLPVPGNPRRRASIEYDNEGRPTQQLYGTVGKRALHGQLWEFDFGDDTTVRGTVMDITYHPSGSVDATVVQNNDISELGYTGSCEAFEFDERGRLKRRYSHCLPEEHDPGYLEFPFDELVTFDDMGRVTEHRVDNLRQDSFSSPIVYQYPTAQTVQLSWPGFFVANSDITIHRLTRTLDASGRVVLELEDVGSDGNTDNKITRGFDGDDCGHESTFDYGNDGLPDAISRTTCTGGRVTSVRDRNMLSGSIIASYAVQPTLAPPRGTASVDVTYDSTGNVLTRSYETTSAAEDAETTDDRGTFTYEAGFGKSGSMDRELPFLTFNWGGGEHSEASCQVERTCPGIARAPQDIRLARCELGIGVLQTPSLFRRVEAAHYHHPMTTVPWVLAQPWEPRAGNFADLTSPEHDVFCCEGCGAELSCVANGR